MKYRALIVDDERIIVNGIMRLPIWLSLDIEPVPAMTGLQALELMEQYRFDLIITDSGCDPEAIAAFQEKGVEVIVV